MRKRTSIYKIQPTIKIKDIIKEYFMEQYNAIHKKRK